MLTFFEYLRQRAFESVIAGVEDAYSHLDSNKAFESGKLPTDTSREAQPKQLDDNSESSPAHDHGANGSAANKSKPLPPRKRGRPKKSGSK